MAGFTLSQIAEKNSKDLVIVFDDGDEFHYSVSVNRMTFPMMARLRKVANKIDEEGGGDEASEDTKVEAVLVLMELLTAWDLKNEDGTPAPIEQDNVVQLPMGMLIQMIEDTMDNISPKAESGNSSSDGSETQ